MLKTTLDDTKSRLDALLTYANGVTGKNNTNIGDAIAELVQLLADERAFEDWLLQNQTNYSEYVNDRVTGQLMEYTFYNRKIDKIRLANITSIRGSAFLSCKATEIYCPNATGIQAGAFRLCENMTVCDVGKPNVFYTIFANCTNLETLILRRFIEPSGTTIFTDTKLGAGNAGGYVYVPNALLSQFQNSTAWANYANVLAFRKIEGSIYELTE